MKAHTFGSIVLLALSLPTFAQNESGIDIHKPLVAEETNRDPIDQLVALSSEQEWPLRFLLTTDLDQVPYGMCLYEYKKETGNCHFLGEDKVIFTKLNNGWAVSYFDVRIDSADFALDSAMLETLNGALIAREKELECSSTRELVEQSLKVRITCKFKT